MCYINIILFLSTTLVYVNGASDNYYFGTFTKGVTKELTSRVVTFVKPAIMKFNMDKAMNLTVHGVNIGFHDAIGTCKLLSGGTGSQHVAIRIASDFWQYKEIRTTIIVYGTYPEGKKPSIGPIDIKLPESAFVLRY